MKKYLICLLLVTVLFPSVALASWWNPLSWFNNWSFNKKDQIVSLEQQKSAEEKLNELQKELNDLKNKQSDSNSRSIESFDISTSNNVEKQLDLNDKRDIKTQTENKSSEIIDNINTKLVISDPTRIFSTNGHLSFSSYEQLEMAEYIKNPQVSFNKPIKIINGVVASFNPGNPNYIKITDVNDASLVINLRIGSDKDYTEIIEEELVEGDKILVYGYGKNKELFEIVGSNGPYEIYRPVIDVDAIFKCDEDSLQCLYHYTNGIKVIIEKTSY